MLKLDFRNEANELDIFITDVIDNFWGYGKNQFIEDVMKHKAKKLNVYISSPGGNVDDALAIYDLLKGYDGEVTTHLTGIVASAATIIALGGQKIIMSTGSIFMIHNVRSGIWGTAEEKRKQAETDDQVEQLIIGIYANKTGMSTDELKSMMDEETWMNAETAKELGFVDEVTNGIGNKAEKVNYSNLKQYGFQNIPTGVYNLINYKENNSNKMEDIKKQIADGFTNLTNFLNKALGKVKDEPTPQADMTSEQLTAKFTEIENKISNELATAIENKATLENKVSEQATEIESLKGEIERLKVNRIDPQPAADPIEGPTKKNEGQTLLSDFVNEHFNSIEKRQLSKKANNG